MHVQRALEVTRQRDLHDSLGHALVALSVQLEAVQRLYAVDPAGAAAQVDAMKDLTRASMAELRRALEGLRTPGLGDRSLRQALHALSHEVGERRIGISSALFKSGQCVARVRLRR